ncbi:hypothetical protein QBK99_12420 [Corticibacterium sp. UT-5YL-CI-8]|nr:hypothetical protein [Tianweitania sp. UT-5YL-CI-8]
MKLGLVTALTAIWATQAIAAEALHASKYLTSAELLKAGFKLLAEGDVLVQSSFKVDRMKVRSEYCPSTDIVASVPSFPAMEGCGVHWIKDRYEGFVRLVYGDVEVVCILDRPERCYRADRLQN